MHNTLSINRCRRHGRHCCLLLVLVSQGRYRDSAQALQERQGALLAATVRRTKVPPHFRLAAADGVLQLVIELFRPDHEFAAAAHVKVLECRVVSHAVQFLRQQYYACKSKAYTLVTSCAEHKSVEKGTQASVHGLGGRPSSVGWVHSVLQQRAHRRSQTAQPLSRPPGRPQSALAARVAPRHTCGLAG